MKQAKAHGAFHVELVDLQKVVREVRDIVRGLAAGWSHVYLAGAVGAKVVAVFGATNERRTSPLRSSAAAPEPSVIVGDPG